MDSFACLPVPRIVVGVDTHRDEHVAVALSASVGARLGELRFPATRRGFAAARAWARRLGSVSAWGVEGTGCYGAGLARDLAWAGQRVVEVNRPNRHTRRMLGGKNDPIDAEAAARAVLSGFATATAKAGDGIVELLRVTRGTRVSAMRARTAAMNQLKALIVTAPPALREQLSPLGPATLVKTCAAFPTDPTDPADPAGDAGVSVEAVVRRNLRTLARRWQLLTEEINIHTAELTTLIRRAAPDLLDEHGVGPDTAAALLITAGDNPHRLRSEAAFAALCGVNPIPASSGKTDRHRLNRGGDRQANAALHQITVVRLATHPETRGYMAGHVNPNRSNKLHVIRCLKRYLARRLYPLLRHATTGVADRCAAHPAGAGHDRPHTPGPEGPQRLRDQGRATGPSRPARCAAPLNPEGRPRTLRGAPQSRQNAAAKPPPQLTHQPDQQA